MILYQWYAYAFYSRGARTSTFSKLTPHFIVDYLFLFLYFNIEFQCSLNIYFVAVV